MAITTNDLKHGISLDLPEGLFQVVEFQHVKPGKGGAFVRSKLRNMKTGAVVEKTFNAGVKVGLAIVERKLMIRGTSFSAERFSLNEPRLRGILDVEYGWRNRNAKYDISSNL